MPEETMSQWDTRDELKFLDGLGMYKWVGRKQALLYSTPDRAAALKKYLRAARRRKCWGGLDKAMIIGHATVELDNVLAWKQRCAKAGGKS